MDFWHDFFEIYAIITTSKTIGRVLSTGTAATAITFNSVWGGIRVNSIDMIKNGILTLYKTNPNIHVNVSINNPKVKLTNRTAVIKGVYPHVFQIEDNNGSFKGRHTFQYVDVLTGNVEILELPR